MVATTACILNSVSIKELSIVFVTDCVVSSREQGGEHKISRGFVPQVVRSTLWAADPEMRQLIGRYLGQQGRAVVAYKTEALQHLPFRHDSSVKREI